MKKIKQDISLGNNLRILRNKVGLTQTQTIAKLQLEGSETDRSKYSRYETGELNIRVSDLVKLTKIFQCSYNDFFDGLE